MTSMFGTNGQQVLALIASIQRFSAEQVDEVTSAWRRGSPHGRNRAWARLSRCADEDARYRILAAASCARREALEAARRLHRSDWAFWAAACDAAAAVAAGAQISQDFESLVAPFATVVPALVRFPGEVEAQSEIAHEADYRQAALASAGEAESMTAIDEFDGRPTRTTA
jgi:hypothetical protein